MSPLSHRDRRPDAGDATAAAFAVLQTTLPVPGDGGHNGYFGSPLQQFTLAVCTVACTVQTVHIGVQSQLWSSSKIHRRQGRSQEFHLGGYKLWCVSSIYMFCAQLVK